MSDDCGLLIFEVTEGLRPSIINRQFFPCKNPPCPAAATAKNYLDRLFGFSNYKATGMIGAFPIKVASDPRAQPGIRQSSVIRDACRYRTPPII
jgi:hypothetical protein